MVVNVERSQLRGVLQELGTTMDIVINIKEPEEFEKKNCRLSESHYRGSSADTKGDGQKGRGKEKGRISNLKKLLALSGELVVGRGY